MPRLPFILLLASPLLAAPAPNLESNIDRPLRYIPDHGDLVIANGRERFNRPLYGHPSAFRVDAGDLPEFSLYLPGKGGVLRLGLQTPAGSKWLTGAASVTTRYHAGSMVYEITDPLLNNSTLRLTILSPRSTPALLAQFQLLLAPQSTPGQSAGSGSDRSAAPDPPPTLLITFGGASTERGKRNGDIGAERTPVSEFFSPKPTDCRDNRFTLSDHTFTLRAKSSTLAGTLPPGSHLTTADAAHWSSPADLLASAGRPTDTPVLLATTPVTAIPQYILIGPTSDQPDPATLFAAEQETWRRVSTQIQVDTPDPFVNAAVPALCLAEDGVWDPGQHAYLHGAVAWRVKLLGWRGAYAGDSLGRHDRTRAHLDTFFARQNTSPVPATLPAADPESNLARSERALHSNGDLTNSHYDMNLVAIDALFRHLLWTGDRDYARRVWPVVTRHLAWERRLFRREFGPDRLPLYEAYACNWASDDLQYSGAGVAHASAYNYFHNLMAARVAEWIGEDPAPYRAESDLIRRAMNRYLWLPDGPDGPAHFAECKDLLGRQLVHPAAALWTYYHTIDSRVPTPAQAQSMGDYVDRRIPHIPLRGPSVPPGCFTLATTTWLPYMWSTNNVVMAETMHTALADFQSGRDAQGFAAFKGALLDSMYTGLCPGNVGMCTQFDAYRREAQRDFADAVGTTSRALVEGLFGVSPDCIADTLSISPHLLASWTHATLTHPDLTLAFTRTDGTDTYTITPHFPHPLTLHFRRGTTEITRPPAATWTITIPSLAPSPGTPGEGRGEGSAQRPSDPHDAPSPSRDAGVSPAHSYATINLSPLFNDSLVNLFTHDYLSPRSPYCSLSLPKQGIGGWCTYNDHPTISDAALRSAHGQLTLDSVPYLTPAAGPNVAFVSMWDNFPHELTLPLTGHARAAHLLLAGTTTNMQSRLDNGEILVTYSDHTTARLPLRNPTTWWPIDRDYFTDDFAFRIDAPFPRRLDLQTGRLRTPQKGHGGDPIPGGSATLLTLDLDPSKDLQSLTFRALSNESVLGLLSLTLEQP